jgi:hypothetical protein
MTSGCFQRTNASLGAPYKSVLHLSPRAELLQSGPILRARQRRNHSTAQGTRPGKIIPKKRICPEWATPFLSTGSGVPLVISHRLNPPSGGRSAIVPVPSRSPSRSQQRPIANRPPFIFGQPTKRGRIAPSKSKQSANRKSKSQFEILAAARVSGSFRLNAREASQTLEPQRGNGTYLGRRGFDEA